MSPGGGAAISACLSLGPLPDLAARPPRSPHRLPFAGTALPQVFKPGQGAP